MKEGVDCIEDVKLDCAPIFMIKECRDTIRARGFVSAQLEHSSFNFLIGNRTIKKVDLLTR